MTLKLFFASSNSFLVLPKRGRPIFWPSSVLNQIRNIINNPTARERLNFNRNIEISDNIKEEYDYATKMLNEIDRRRQRAKEAYEAGVDT